jgi:hypothetical protein
MRGNQTVSLFCNLVCTTEVRVVEVLDFLMGYESYLRKRRHALPLSRLFACKVGDVLSFHLQIYRSAFAKIFPRSHPKRESSFTFT